MKSLFSPKLLVAAALVLGAVGGASAAHARSDVFLSVGVQPGYYGQYGYEAERDWRRDAYRWDHRGRDDRYARRFGPYGDLDHDGIRNRDDRDRDGDGVPNRYDRSPDNPYRR